MNEHLLKDDDDLHDHCDFEDNCKNYKAKCLWCCREYDADVEDTDYYEPKIVADSESKKGET